MKAEIITIGDEILIGQIHDTNATWISQRLNDAGIRVYERVTIGDDAGQITGAVDRALARAEVVIVTGGLGPTKDDITKQTLATCFGGELALHEPTHAFLEQMLNERGIAFNDLNRGQAYLPTCCTVLPNRNGTAPGMWFERDGRVLVSLPGVPFEMKALVADEVLPRLREHFKLRSIVHRTAITFGLAESVLATTIAPWEEALPPYLKLAYLPNPQFIRLRLSAYEVDHERAEREIERQFAALRGLIPAYFLGFEGATVQSATADLLTARGETLATAESCTGGAIASSFTAMAGASDYFLGGVVSYSNEAKMQVLGVDPAALAEHGAVSREVAEQMAAGARRVLGSTYAIATTGIAGPGGATPDKPVGTVWMAIATPGGVYARLAHYGQLREQNIQRATAQAVNMLRLYLVGGRDVLVNEGVL